MSLYELPCNGQLGAGVLKPFCPFSDLFFIDLAILFVIAIIVIINVM